MKKFSLLLFVFLAVAAVGYAYTVVGGGVCQCDSCSDCTNALNDNTNCSAEVQLTAPITNYSGNCIDNPANFSNKIFNCQGYQIDGDGTGLVGILIDHKENNTIESCWISDFMYGVWLHYSNNNTVESISVYNNSYSGVLLAYSQNNTVHSVDAAYNGYGIEVSTSSYNNVTGNVVYDNTDRGISIVASSHNIFSYNEVYDNTGNGFHISSTSNNNSFTSNTVYDNGGDGFALFIASNNTFYLNNVSKNDQHGFYANSNSTGNALDSNMFCLNNQGRNGSYDVRDDDSNGFSNTTCGSSQPSGKCVNACSICYTVNGGGVCTVAGGSDCSCLYAAVDDNANCYKEVRLSGNISNGGTCIDTPPRFENKTLDCLGHTIDGGVSLGYGVYLINKSGITIKNCVFKGFEAGIYGEDVRSSSFVYVSAINNVGRFGRGGFPPQPCGNGYGIFLLESYNISLLHINANSNLGGSGGMFAACYGYGLYLNISNSRLDDVTAEYNQGGGKVSFGGGAIGIYLDGSGNTLTSIKSNYNIGGSGTFAGGPAHGLIITGRNNYLRSINANNNSGGSGRSSGGSSYGVYLMSLDSSTLSYINANGNSPALGGFSYGMYFDGVTNSSTTTVTTDSNSHGITVVSSTDNTFNNIKTLNNDYYGFYLDSASTGNTIRSSRFCGNNQSGGDYYDVYDEDTNTFEFNACNTSEPAGICVYSCVSAPSGGGGGGDNKKHKLSIHDIEHQYAKEGETKSVLIVVENDGDYMEYGIALSLVCPSSLSCENASLGDLSASKEKNATIGITGSIPGDYLIKAKADSEMASAETEFYFTVKPECTKNDDCAVDEYCQNNKCVPVKCDCGYVQNHACVPYECCDNANCDDASVCSDHKCVPVKCDCGYVQNHACVPYECCSDSDCAKNNRCVEHKCVPVAYDIKIEAPTVNVDGQFAIELLADGAPLAGVSVVVVYPDGSTATFLSDDNGRVVIPAQQEGKYKFYLKDNPNIVKEGYAQLAGQPTAQPPLTPGGQPAPSACCAFGVCGDLFGICWHWLASFLVIGAILIAAVVFLMQGERMARRR